MAAVLRNPLNWLLVLVPVALLARFLSFPALVIFAISGLAIVPLAKWMGNATEELSVHVGPGIGGLLNATFGNATELIIAVFALQAGLVNVVEASICGRTSTSTRAKGVRRRTARPGVSARRSGFSSPRPSASL